MSSNSTNLGLGGNSGRSPSTPPRPSLEPGRTIGAYDVVRLLGEGGMGSVFEARHRAIGRRVAVKVLRPELSNDPQVLERFLREARAATEVRHRNIVEVTDFGAENGQAFLVMEYLTGESLRSVIDREAPMPLARIASLLAPVCRALGYAHSKSIIHRDIKPDNIFVSVEDGSGDVVPKIVDFGIAHARPEGELRLTTTGAWLGTPLYMAPEQAGGAKDVTPAADQYALGCVLYEALTGRLPILADTYNGLVLAKATTDPEPIQNLRPDLNPAVAHAIMRALARSPGERFETLQQLGAVLESAATSAGGSLAPPRESVEMASTVAANAGTAMAYSRRSAPPIANAHVASATAATLVSSVAARPRAKPPVALWVALVVLLGGGGAFIALRGRSGASAQTSQNTNTRSTTTAPIEPNVATAVLQFFYTPESAELRLDGELLGRGHASAVRPRDDRPHELRVTAAGHAPVTRVIRIRGDEEFTGRLDPLADAAAAAPSPTTPTGTNANNTVRADASAPVRIRTHNRLGSGGLFGVDDVDRNSTGATPHH